jgi:xylulokinase
MRTGGLVAGVDCSTQATKVVLVEQAGGRIVAMGRAPHNVSGEGGARETEPAEWWTALRQALAATDRAEEVGAISVAGQQHGLVVLGEDRRPLRPAMLWNDTRPAADAELLTGVLGPAVWATRTGLRPVASFTVSKWAWLRRNEPEVAARTVAIRLPHDYLTERLTGAGVTDRGDASGTGWWSPIDGRYASDVLELPQVDLDPAMLPRVLGPAEPAGQVTPEAAALLGLRPGTLVGPGTGDNMGAALGLGVDLGQPVMSLGTSGTVYAVTDRPTADASGVVAGFADASGRYLPLAATLNCTLAVDRVAGWLGLDRDDVDAAGDIVVLPFLDGERTPNLPQAAGSIHGLRHATTPQQVLMATYEGAVASLLGAIAAIDAAGGSIDPDAPLVLIGGGARGRTWRDVARRLSGRPVVIPAAEELVALGAAVQASAILNGEAVASVVARWATGAGERLEPLSRDDGRMARIAATLDAVAGSHRLSGRDR